MYCSFINLSNRDALQRLSSSVASTNYSATLLVHPTWAPRTNTTTALYYNFLEYIKQRDEATIVLAEPGDLDVTANELSSINPENLFFIETVEDADAQPVFGWQSFFQILKDVKIQRIAFGGQNINFWQNIDSQQLPKGTKELNTYLRRQLDELGADGKVVLPSQCLGSLILKIYNNLSNIEMELTPAMYPAHFVELGGHSTQPATLSRLVR